MRGEEPLNVRSRQCRPDKRRPKTVTPLLRGAHQVLEFELTWDGDLSLRAPRLFNRPPKRLQSVEVIRLWHAMRSSYESSDDRRLTFDQLYGSGTPKYISRSLPGARWTG